MVYAVVRVRGTVNIKPDIKKTLQLLRLTRVNHCVLIPENKVTKGMLYVVKDYVTWGTVSQDALHDLIKKRGMITGNKPLTDEYLSSATSFKDTASLAKALFNNEIIYKEIPEVKPLFRLHPPVQGFEGIKRSYTMGGALGYRGKDMDKLLKRMLS